VPFPSYEVDLDVDMSDSSSSPVESAYPNQFHMRFDSTASSSSTSSDGNTHQLYTPRTSSDSLVSVFPSFNVIPEPFFNADGSVNIDSHNFARLATPPPNDKPVGILQPKSSFTHSG
jgi:hypothetical protein